MKTGKEMLCYMQKVKEMREGSQQLDPASFLPSPSRVKIVKSRTEILIQNRKKKIIINNRRDALSEGPRSRETNLHQTSIASFMKSRESH